MKEIIIIAGPNGAGKTSFANQYLPQAKEGLVLLNADEVAKELASRGMSGPALDIAAARILLETIEDLVSREVEFMIETTLSSRTYAGRIRGWRNSGYIISLIYLRLSSVNVSLERVKRRVAAGGHDIPEAAIRRRFSRSLANLENIYKPIVDEWYVWDSLEGDFELIQAWDGE